MFSVIRVDHTKFLQGDIKTLQFNCASDLVTDTVRPIQSSGSPSDFEPVDETQTISHQLNWTRVLLLDRHTWFAFCWYWSHLVTRRVLPGRNEYMIRTNPSGIVFNRVLQSIIAVLTLRLNTCFEVKNRIRVLQSIMESRLKIRVYSQI